MPGGGGAWKNEKSCIVETGNILTILHCGACVLARHKEGGREGRNEKRCTVKTGNILNILCCGECVLAT